MGYYKSITFLKVLLIALLTTVLTARAQDKPAYQLFKSNGKKAKYNKMIKDLAKADMVFFGEYHTNPIQCW